jgi:hypothetical protein
MYRAPSTIPFMPYFVESFRIRSAATADPRINLAGLKLPEPANLMGGHGALGNPCVNGVLGDPEVNGNVVS